MYGFEPENHKRPEPRKVDLRDGKTDLVALCRRGLLLTGLVATEGVAIAGGPAEVAAASRLAEGEGDAHPGGARKLGTTIPVTIARERTEGRVVQRVAVVRRTVAVLRAGAADDA